MSSASAVQEGKLKHVSASQIKLYQTCGRRWYADKVLGIKDTGSIATETGEKIHAELDLHFTKGVIPSHEASRLALQDPSLPKFGKDRVLVEYPRDYALGLEIADVNLKGRIDLLWERSDSHVSIIDHKSTKNLRYGKRPEELAVDTQMVLYSRWVFETFPTVGEVTVAHNYISTDLTKPPAAKVVWTDPLDRQHISNQFEVLEQVVSQMKDAAQYAEADLVLANPGKDSCKAFGKTCPFAANCTAFQETFARLTPAEDETPAPQPEGEQKMSLAEKLARRNSSATAPPESPASSSSSTVRINPPDAAFYPGAAKKGDESLATRLDAIEARLAALEAKTKGAA